MPRVLPLWSKQNSRTFPGIFKVCRTFSRSWHIGKIEMYPSLKHRNTNFPPVFPSFDAVRSSLTKGYLQKANLLFCNNIYNTKMSVFYNNLEQTLVSLHNVFENVSVLIDYRIKIQGFFQVFMKKPSFFKESKALKAKSKNSRVSRFSRGRTNPVCLNLPEPFTFDFTLVAVNPFLDRANSSYSSHFVLRVVSIIGGYK